MGFSYTSTLNFYTLKYMDFLLIIEEKKLSKSDYDIIFHENSEFVFHTQLFKQFWKLIFVEQVCTCHKLNMEGNTSACGFEVSSTGLHWKFLSWLLVLVTGSWVSTDFQTGMHNKVS